MLLNTLNLATTATLFSAVHVLSSPVDIPVISQNFKGEQIRNTLLATAVLNSNWYNSDTGLWNGLWWNSGNALTTLADFAKLRPAEAIALGVPAIIENTFNKAQKTSVKAYSKHIGADGMMTSKYCIAGIGFCDGKRDIEKRQFADFLNTYYDDEGWWALGLIHAYDATGTDKYLDAAVTIFKDMRTGTGGPCKGGIYWSKDRSYVNAIANELYLAVTASLANRIPANKAYYVRTAEAHWKWFAKSGMINSKNLINDGLNSKCKNNGQVTWSYNQGVVLGGLAELYRATGNRDYLSRAKTLALASIDALTNDDGVLSEADHCELKAGHCGQDGQQFKGIYVRNVRYLNDVLPKDEFRDFIQANADSIWKNDRNEQGKLGVAWTGPYVNATGPTHSSAMDVLVAAIAV